MIRVTYKDIQYTVSSEKSLLESLEQQQVTLPFSCRKGTCQSCKMKVLKGKIPLASQNGLRQTEQALGYFLPCVCYPEHDMVIADIEQTPLYQTTIIAINKLNDEIAEIHLHPPENFTYYPGQYIRIYKKNSPYPLYRNYSLASVPRLENTLILQVKCVPDGLISSWLHQTTPGMALEFSGPFGDCFYQKTMQPQPLLFMATGSGLSPCYGIIREALLQNHAQDIWLFHGVGQQSQLYHEENLQQLSLSHSHFHYVPCLSKKMHSNYTFGLITDMIDHKIQSMRDFVVFLAGSSMMVNAASLKLFLAGVSLKDIYKDPFN